MTDKTLPPLQALQAICDLQGTEENEWDAVERVIPEMCAIARAAISAQKPQAEPVAGWRLVPVEPTMAMRKAYHYTDEAQRELVGASRATWAAMLAAAPLAAEAPEPWRNVLQTLLDIWHAGQLQVRPEAAGYWSATVEAGEAILGRLDQLAAAQPQKAPQPLTDAARALLQWHLDRAEVHPCDESNIGRKLVHCVPEARAVAEALGIGTKPDGGAL